MAVELERLIILLVTEGNRCFYAGTVTFGGSAGSLIKFQHRIVVVILVRRISRRLGDDAHGLFQCQFRFFFVFGKGVGWESTKAAIATATTCSR